MIPLYQLPTRVRVVRIAEKYDDAGGAVEEKEVPIYDNLCCRFTSYGGRYPDPDKQHEFGKSGKRLWKILSTPALVVQFQDRVKVPWGTPPNWYVPIGMPYGFYPKIVITLPDLSEVTLEWLSGKYIDAGEEYTLFYTGTNWRFVDDNEALTYDFDNEYAESYDVTKDAALWDFGYEVSERTGDEIDYRVVQYYHAYDECGKPHHTIMLVEIECDPPAKDETLNPIWN